MPRELRTPLCNEMGIEYPIFSAGIGSAAGPELVAAVSNAGGLGVLGASGMAPDEMGRQIRRVRELTNMPFGVNIIIEETEEGDRAWLMDAVAAAGAHGAAAVVLFWGDPAPYVQISHRDRVKVFIQVGSVGEAAHAAESGVDAVIAQGFEAGGHVRGTTSIWELLPAVVQAVKPLPVLASGGIGDGAGVGTRAADGSSGRLPRNSICRQRRMLGARRVQAPGGREHGRRHRLQRALRRLVAERAPQDAPQQDL